MHESLGLNIELTHQCKVENGLDYSDDEFKIIEIIGDFELLKIQSQYGAEYIINPNQIKEL
jgi:hypothetical protein